MELNFRNFMKNFVLTKILSNSLAKIQKLWHRTARFHSKQLPMPLIFLQLDFVKKAKDIAEILNEAKVKFILGKN